MSNDEYNKMAFANLFKGLSPVVESVKSPAQPVSTLRNQTDGKRDPDRKRRAQCEQTGHYGKKQLYQAHAARTTLHSFHMHNTGSEHGEVMYSHSHNNLCHKGQNYKSKNNSNVTRKKQEPKKKSEWEKNQHQHKNRGRPACKDGGHQTRPTWRTGGGDRKNERYTRVLKRDNDLCELAKKVEQKSSEQPVNTEESEVTEAVPDIFNEPLSEMSTSPPPCGNSSSTTHVHQQQPDISSHKESENKDESSTDCVKQPQKRQKKDRQKKKLEMQDSHRQSTKKIPAHSREHQPPQISLEGTGVLTFGSPAEPQIRQTGTHNLSFKPLPPLMRHNQSILKHTSEEGKAATPLKELFKTLDTAVFHFGR
ncbi:hypothetical protein GBF38_000927 [Nibea albiflora]|nr:hypothetical protein GBF38_000927 [Nibea albiflora]